MKSWKMSFQFQDGAIKGHARILRNIVQNLFQFQDGAIKGKKSLQSLTI